MNRLTRDLILILALAALWAISGYAIGEAIKFFVEGFGVTILPLGVILASINLIIGMLLFKGITRDPTAERIFFEGPEKKGEGNLNVGCLWVMPVSLLLIGLYVWLVVGILRLIFPK
jgi:hypothetical protein